MAAAGGRQGIRFSTTQVALATALAASRPMWIQRQGVSSAIRISRPLTPEADARSQVAKGLHRFAPSLSFT
jgi:hypothetical protein